MQVHRRIFGLVLLVNACIAAAPAYAERGKPAPGRIIVSFDDAGVFSEYHTHGKAAGLAKAEKLVGVGGLKHGALLMPILDVDNRQYQLITAWDVDPSTDIPGLAKVVSKLPGVKYAEPDYELTIDATPNDPSFGSLWGMNADKGINAEAAWDIQNTSESVLIAVIDSGVDYNHPDLAANMWRNPGEVAGNGVDDDRNGYIDDVYGYDFANNDPDPMDDNNHGTHCAGTIGAVGNNGVGVVGVGWRAKIMAMKFMNSAGSGLTSAAISSLNYAVSKGARISNNSWGGGGYSSSLYSAIQAAQNNGHIFVAAAGNSGVNIDTTPSYPASYALTNVIAVAAIDSAGNRASFSNYGSSTVDLAAPGVGILSTLPGGNYGSFSGTSMAAPHTTGVLGLLAARAPNASTTKIINALLDGSVTDSALTGITTRGSRLSAYGSLVSLGSPPADTTPPVTAVSSPASGATISGLAYFTCTASDNVGVSNVEFYIDGTLRSSDATSSYEYAWDSSLEGNGTHTLYCVAFDAAGNNSRSTSVQVTTANTIGGDSIPPTVIVTSPTQGATVSRNTSVSINATAYDDTAMSRVEFSVNGTLLGTDSTTPYQISWRVPGAKGKAYTLTAKAFDVSGNYATSSVSVKSGN